MTSQRAAAPYEVVVVKADSNVNKEKTETLVSNVSIYWILLDKKKKQF